MSRRLLIPALLISSLFLRGDEPMTLTIQEAKQKHEAALLGLPGVVSVGVGRGPDGNPAVIVGLDRPRPETQAKIPPQVEGYPLLIQIMGPLRAR